jgi:hypothetical protein
VQVHHDTETHFAGRLDGFLDSLPCSRKGVDVVIEVGPVKEVRLSSRQVIIANLSYRARG